MNPHPHVRLYVELASMDWHHLPIAGGYWDQDPELLDSFRVIRAAIAKEEREKKRREDLNKKGKYNTAGQ